MRLSQIAMVVFALFVGCGGGTKATDNDAAPAVDAAPPIDAEPLPEDVTVSGQVVKLGVHLENGADETLDNVNLLSSGLDPAVAMVSGTDGAYSFTLPTNREVSIVANRAGYMSTYTPLSIGYEVLENQPVFITEAAWYATATTTYNILSTTFACQTPSLVGQDCLYAAFIGQILDSGTLGARAPVAGVTAGDFSILGVGDEDWYVRGPYFLDADGAANAGNAASVTAPGSPGTTVGGYYAVFVEVPLTGPNGVAIDVGIVFNDGAVRNFGPRTVLAHRAPGGAVTVVDLTETN